MNLYEMGIDNIEGNLADIKFKTRKYNLDDVKEKIQNAQKRLDEKFVWENKEMVGDIWVKNAVHKIFQEEFGKGLLE